MSRATAFALALGLVMLVTGCAKKTPAPPAPVAAAPAPVEAAPPAPPPPPAPVAATAPPPLTEDEMFARKSLDDLNAEAPLSDVFFDVDRSDLRDDARAALQQHARWLSRWPSTRIVVEGHCDERGTAEYNLALGERRAAAVRSYLADLGVQPERILAVSKGKETPVCFEQTDDCWQQNRRGHFLFTAK